MLEDSIHADFYQTIIKNNLFAPLGTVLNPTPKPGAHLKLIGTLTRQDPAKASAILQNTTTGEQQTVVVGDVLGEFTIMKIEAKQITLDHHGKAPVRLRLREHFFSTEKRSLKTMLEKKI
ncbi:hypothetical protein C6503_03770 [Candidatus Poribacteria bacterium]|nr:MAG: hypothetical protein C6503_03770 [Candidatus Poribacteria bacterium]